MLSPQHSVWFGAVLVVVGYALLLHDVLYHLGKVRGVGKEVRVGRFHLHHGYVGLALIVAGCILLLL